MKGLLQVAALLFLGLLTVHAFRQEDLIDSTCSKNKRCKAGCCGKSGYCGFGPEYCSPKNCISNCNAKSECGSRLE
jgi:chitinase